MRPLLIQLAVGDTEHEAPDAYRTTEVDFIGATSGEGSGSLHQDQLQHVCAAVADMLIDLFDGIHPGQVSDEVHRAMNMAVVRAAL